MTPGLQRCEKEKEVAGAVAFILVVIFGHRTRSRWQGQTGLFGQLFTGFIKTDHRSLGILLPMIDLSVSSMAQTNSALDVSGMHTHLSARA